MILALDILAVLLLLVAGWLLGTLITRIGARLHQARRYRRRGFSWRKAWQISGNDLHA